jgi:hypothetical protein
MPRAERSLSDAIRDGMSATEAAAALRDVAEALQQLAVAGIVHSDIKPANVLWWGERWCVADFGIARIIEVGTATHTWAGTGTLEYRAPELWRGEPETALSDLYALGCLAAEALTGRVVFRGPDFRRQHETDVPALPVGADPRVARVVLRLLAKEPEQRPKDARQVLELLAPSSGLTAAHQVLLRRAAAAERRAREVEVFGQHRRHLEELRDRARQALRLLWDELADEARLAVSDADVVENSRGYFLTVADTRIAAVRLNSGDDGDPLLAAELVIHDGEGTTGILAANLVVQVVDGLPRWRVVRWAQNALSPSRIQVDLTGRTAGLAADTLIEYWRRRREAVPPLIAKITDATPNALPELYSWVVKDS